MILPANYAGNYEKTFIGTGPFKLEKYQAKVGVSFVRNPDYWGEKALPQRVQFTFYADQQAQILALQGHQADVMPTFTVQGGQGLINNPEFKVVGVKSSAHRQIHMRVDSPQFKDKRVRQALALSWKPNDKGDVWTFKLRENVKFHDGQPFTAKDVAATFDRLADPAPTSPSSCRTMRRRWASAST